MCCSRFVRRLAACAIAGIFFAGCDRVQEVASTVQDKAGKVAEDLKAQGEGLVEEAKQQAQLAGHFELFNGQVKTSACHFRLLLQGSGRPHVFQLRSYQSSAREELPSVCFQAQVRAESVEELVGQTVSGRLFVQSDADGPIWYSEPDAPVEVQIDALQESNLAGQFIGGALRDTESDHETAAVGSFTAVP